jgi:hypothetical protein
MRVATLILALLNGGYMLLDGLYVMTIGKYIGPDKPGPWANLFYGLKINVFNLGPLFILFGLLWLSFAFGVFTGQRWAYTLGICMAVASLWYLPVGTLFSLIILVLLFTARQKIAI